MKKFTLTFSLLLSLAWGEVAWMPDFQSAQAKAEKEHKPIYALLVSHTCRWCRKLENRTLENPEVSEYINSRFVPVLLYREDGGFPDTIRASMVPTTFLLRPDGKNLVEPIVGYWEPTEYMSDLKAAMKKFTGK